MGFAFQGFGFCGAFFGIDELNRCANSCIGAASTLIVPFYAAGEVICYAGVEGIIGAFEDVDVPHVIVWPLRAYDAPIRRIA